jgi:hypothetical protein
MIVDAFIVSIVKGPSVMNGDGKSLQKLADKYMSVCLKDPRIDEKS